MGNIKLLVMDVDGTLTDGKIYIGADGEMMKAFHVQDGYGIANILPKRGVIPVIITGRNSKIVEHRAKELHIEYLCQGVSNKLSCLKKIANSLKVDAMEIAYIGDDLNDMECIQYCGYTACPADAVLEIIPMVDYVCKRTGGNGAVREFIECIVNM